MLLKQLVSVIKLPICIIFNRSLETGIFQKLMKNAKVVPLHKSSDRNDSDNYRPISLLPVISKILEKLVYKSLVEHLDKNDILYHKQYGFRKKYSTSDAMTNLVGDVLKAFEDSSMILAVYIDLKKAFNMVSHLILLKKLSSMGVNNVELEWFRSYLCGRGQCVTLGKSVSSIVPLDVGVAQGSLLGVLMFSLTINDLYKCLRYSQSILYADDTTIYLVGKSVRFLRVKLQADLNSLSEWLRLNRLKLNVKKTKYMLFNKESLNLDIELTVEGEAIDNVSVFKFLGLTVDQSLSFNEHFAQTYDKLFKPSYIIRYLAKMLPKSCLRSLYFAFYHSHMYYGLPVWFPLLKRESQKTLFLLQKQIVRCINGVNFRAHCMPLFRKQVILTLEDQLKLNNCKLMFRVLNCTISKSNRNKKTCLTIPAAQISLSLNINSVCLIEVFSVNPYRTGVV